MRGKKKLSANPGSIQWQVQELLERKLKEISEKWGEELNAKDVDVLLKLANLQDKVGGRPLLAASVAVVEELLLFLEECDPRLKESLAERLSEFFARMRAEYE